jgi:dihydroorotase-like cyclic amidohydrolase
MLAGDIDTLATDHAPHLFRAKERGWKNIFDAPAGSPGLETMLPVMLTQVHNGRLDLPTLVRLTSENVARLYGLYPRKGTIQIGSDADLTLVDPSAHRVLKRAQMVTKGRDTACFFDGWETVGAPVMTIVRGQVVMRDGEIVARPGCGCWIPGSAARETR